MIPADIRAQLARALGRPLDGQTEMRLAAIMWAVLSAGGEEAERTLISACDSYARVLERHASAAAPTAPPRRPGG